MAANEFEKNVRKAMDEFKLHPSDGVWKQVEETLREKKKKRRILFFFIFSLAGLALTGYGIYNFSTRQVSHQDAGKAENLHGINNNSIHSTAVPDSGATAFKKQAGAEKNIGLQGPRSEVRARKIKISKQNKNVLFRKRNFFIATAINDKNNRGTAKNTREKTNQVKAIENVTINEQPRFLEDTLHEKNITGSAEKTTAMNEAADTISIKNQENKTIEEKKAAKKGINKSAQKLKWGIIVSMGSSTITNDRFSFKSSDARADLLYSSPGSVSGGSFTPYPPTANHSAFAFKAGLILKKDISRRSTIAMGLQYAYLGDRIKTAITQNISLQLNNFPGTTSYYSAVPQKTFTNRFHFIELPVMYDWRITGHGNHFLSLDAGISPALLIATNGLVYDTAARGIYFHNKSSFTRMHFNFMSGLSYHFDKGSEWSIGPQFYFDVSKLIKTDFDKRKYLLYGGIDAKIFFEKKKKK